MSWLKKRRTGFALAGLIMVTAIGWAMMDPCYCWVESEPVFHLKETPDGCAVAEMPEAWTGPNGEEISFWNQVTLPGNGRIEMDRLQFRKLEDAPGRVLIAREGELEYGEFYPGVYSAKQYRLSIPSPGRPMGKIEDVTRADWDRADKLPLTARHGDSRLIDMKVGAYPRRYEYRDTEPLLSPNAKWIAVWSHKQPNTQLSGNAILSPDWYKPPQWRTADISISEVSTGRLIYRIDGWGCPRYSLDDMRFHGDGLFALALDNRARRILVCGMPGADAERGAKPQPPISVSPEGKVDLAKITAITSRVERDKNTIRLVVVVDLDIHVAGTYRLVVDINPPLTATQQAALKQARTNQGSYFGPELRRAQGDGSAELAAGKQQLEASFSEEKIAHMQSNGPFVIDYVTVTYKRGAQGDMLADHRENAGFTAWTTLRAK